LAARRAAAAHRSEWPRRRVHRRHARCETGGRHGPHALGAGTSLRSGRRLRCTGRFVGAPRRGAGPSHAPPERARAPPPHAPQSQVHDSADRDDQGGEAAGEAETASRKRKDKEARDGSCSAGEVRRFGGAKASARAAGPGAGGWGQARMGSWVHAESAIHACMQRPAALGLNMLSETRLPPAPAPASTVPAARRGGQQRQEAARCVERGDAPAVCCGRQPAGH
jgi:hypothetical protein